MLSYQGDLWDSVVPLKEATEAKQKQITALKTFFKNYRKALDAYKDQTRKALVQLEKDLATQPTKKQAAKAQKTAPPSARQRADTLPSDSLSTTIGMLRTSTEEMVKQAEASSGLVQRQVIEGIEAYEKL